MRRVVGLGAFPRPPPTPGRCDWPRPSPRTPPTSPDGWAPYTARWRSLPGCRPRSRVARPAGIPVIGLWARVPHYVSAMPYPEASAALIEGLCAVTGTVLDSSPLRTAGEASRPQVDELIGANPGPSGDGPSAGGRARLRRGQLAGSRLRAAQRGRDRRRARAVPQRRRALRTGRPPAAEQCPRPMRVGQVLGEQGEEDHRAMSTTTSTSPSHRPVRSRIVRSGCRTRGRCPLRSPVRTAAATGSVAGGGSPPGSSRGVRRTPAARSRFGASLHGGGLGELAQPDLVVGLREQAAFGGVVEEDAVTVAVLVDDPGLLAEPEGRRPMGPAGG